MIIVMEHERLYATDYSVANSVTLSVAEFLNTEGAEISTGVAEYWGPNIIRFVAEVKPVTIANVLPVILTSTYDNIALAIMERRKTI